MAPTQPVVGQITKSLKAFEVLMILLFYTLYFFVLLKEEWDESALIIIDTNPSSHSGLHSHLQ